MACFSVEYLSQQDGWFRSHRVTAIPVKAMTVMVMARQDSRLVRSGIVCSSLVSVSDDVC